MKIEYIFIILFIAILVIQIKKKFFPNEEEEERKELEFKKATNLDLWKLTKLTEESSLFGLEKYLYRKTEYYFDDEYFYAIKANKPVIKHLLSDIKEVHKTSFTINDRRVWEIIIQHSDYKTLYKITVNEPLTPTGFSQFLDKISENIDSTVDSNLLW